MDARLNITINGQNGDLVDMIPYDVPDADVKRMARGSPPLPDGDPVGPWN
ncbi:MAG: hypothetical protein WC824_07950 [Bacteroidota bacterium]|jgi:hypothetical protein